MFYIYVQKKNHNSLDERPKYASTKVTIVTSKKVFFLQGFYFNNPSIHILNKGSTSQTDIYIN